MGTRWTYQLARSLFGFKRSLDLEIAPRRLTPTPGSPWGHGKNEQGLCIRSTTVPQMVGTLPSISVGSVGRVLGAGEAEMR